MAEYSISPNLSGGEFTELLRRELVDPLRLGFAEAGVVEIDGANSINVVLVRCCSPSISTTPNELRATVMNGPRIRSASSISWSSINARVLSAPGAEQQLVREVLHREHLGGQHRGQFGCGLMLPTGEQSLLPEVLVAGLRLPRLEHDLDRDDVDDDADEGGAEEHRSHGGKKCRAESRNPGSGIAVPPCTSASLPL